MATYWDERYSGDDYAYGTEPNDFLRAEAHRIPPGPVLCLAEGEGRNAVFLAGLGHPVTAVDLSAEGLRKAEQLARRHGVTLELIQADLADFDLGIDRWSGIVEIFVHVPPVIRRRIHTQIPLALRAGGAFVIEVYRQAQLAHDTGGPKDASLLCSLADLREETAPLELVIAREIDREIHEGRFHTGASSTVQLVGHRR